MKNLHSVRVEPHIAPHVIRWAGNYSLKVQWYEAPADSFMTFAGSKDSIDRVSAFVDGCKAILDLAKEQANEQGKCRFLGSIAPGQ